MNITPQGIRRRYASTGVGFVQGCKNDDGPVRGGRRGRLHALGRADGGRLGGASRASACGARFQRHRPVLRRGAILGVELGSGAGVFSKPPLIAWIIGARRGVRARAKRACGCPRRSCIRRRRSFVFWLGRRLYDVRIGALSALAFATLPGVSLSAGLISTDVPLLLCWALALSASRRCSIPTSWWPALLLGAAFGAGINAKYAMAWFILLCGGLFGHDASAARRAEDKRLWSALTFGIAMIAPNVVWNYAHSSRRSRTRLTTPTGPAGFSTRQGAGILRRAVRRVRSRPLRSPSSSSSGGWRDGLRRCGPPAAGVSVADHRDDPGAGVSVARACQLGRRPPMWPRACWSSPPWYGRRLGLAQCLVRRPWCDHVALIAFGTAMAGRCALPFKTEPFAAHAGLASDLANATRAELDAAPQGRATLRRRAVRRPRCDGRAALLHAR